MRTLISYFFMLSCIFHTAPGHSQEKKNSGSANRKIDSLLQLLKTEKEDTGKINLLNEIARNNWKQAEYDSASKYNDLAFSLANKISFKNGIANAYTTKGVIMKYKGDYKEALIDYNSALKIYEEIKNVPGAANSYNNIGIVYRYLGNYPLALNNHFTALKLREKIKDSAAIAASNNNIGLVYFDELNCTEALAHYFITLNYFKRKGDKRALGDCYSNIGGAYENMGRYAEAIKYHLLSLQFRESINNKKGVADCLSNLGTTYSSQGDSAFHSSPEGKKMALEINYKKAEKYFLSSIKIKEEIGDKQGLADTYNNLGPLYVKFKEPGKARSSLTRSLSLAKELRGMDVISTCYSGFALLDSAEGDYKSAVAFYKLYILYRDSLNNAETTKKTVRTSMQFDFDKKTTADSIKNAETAKQENLKHDQEIRQQKIYSYGGVVGFILMLIIAGISFRAYRQKQNANLIISHQKELVEEKQREILDSIHYAKRIQNALLPTEKYIERTIKRLIKN